MIRCFSLALSCFPFFFLLFISDYRCLCPALAFLSLFNQMAVLVEIYQIDHLEKVRLSGVKLAVVITFNFAEPAGEAAAELGPIQGN
jgi:hypothetical protein